MDTFAAPQDDSKTPAEESVGCAWAFVGMLGITFGWLLNCGITMVAIIYSVQLGMESSQPSNPITSTQAFAAAIVVSVLAFTALAYLAQFSLLPRQLPSPVYRRWRWATLIGSVAYWLSSWLLFYLWAGPISRDLVELLDSIYNDPLAEALVYLIVAAVGMLAGAAAMLPMTLSQWWIMRKYVSRAAHWPAYMMLCNALPVSFIYVCLSTFWRHGGWN